MDRKKRLFSTNLSGTNMLHSSIDVGYIRHKYMNRQFDCLRLDSLKPLEDTKAVLKSRVSLVGGGLIPYDS